MSPENSQVSPPGGVCRLAGHKVARIGYGAMQLRRCEHDPVHAVAVLRRAIELGVDHIDTAEFYGDGFVNRMIREVLRPNDGIVVASKVGADPNPRGKAPLKFAQRPEQLRASVERNLVSLGVDQIPLVNLRRADAGPGITPEGEQIVDMDAQIAVMIAMRDEGKIGSIGLSGVDLDGLRHLLSAGIACVQNAYSLVSREFEEMVAFCLAKDIAWVPFFPLGGATSVTPKVTETSKVIAIAKRINASPAQVGLAWLLQHSPHTLLIPGTADLEHLEQNLAVAVVHLDAAAMAELTAI